ncbi:MAG: hypothetical protein GXO30_00590 [Epsilonproteobacteria bacterium]|nr:hypothetical protein [Campylobacterota bacterium]
MSQLNQANTMEEDEIDLKELWKTIKGGKKVIFITMFVIVTMTLVYALSIPNIYKSKAVLIPKAEKSSGLGGLGGLAAMAGISVGGGSMTPDIAFNSLLKNYEFMKKFIVKNKIYEHYTDENVDKNYVFALGFRDIYEFFKSDKKEQSYEEELFGLVKVVQKNLSIASDKKSGLITVSYSDADRAFTPKVVNDFLNDASEYLVSNNLNIINSKLDYFSKELQKAESFELRTSISGMISNIVQEKVMMKSKRYYQCDVLTTPSVSYVKDKTKPKRALILVVAFITSLILGVFIVFFRNFIKKGEI